MDMGIVMKTPSGAVLTLSLSFNNDGPIGSFFRYICDKAHAVNPHSDFQLWSVEDCGVLLTKLDGRRLYAR